MLYTSLIFSISASATQPEIYFCPKKKKTKKNFFYFFLNKKLFTCATTWNKPKKKAEACLGSFVILLASSKNKNRQSEKWEHWRTGLSQQSHMCPSVRHASARHPHMRLGITLIHTNTQSGRVSQCPFNFVSVLSMYYFFVEAAVVLSHAEW